MTPDKLPINAVLEPLIAALKTQCRAVLQAPPGAGKTTVVPLALLDSGLCSGRILMLEPRRLATRAAAERMAQTLGEKPGQTIGYRMRGESKVSPVTKVEVITEGILTRMLQDDPSLEGIGAIIFDEFHERSLASDLGLALAWASRNALRDDLIILVMSATLDAEPVAALLDNAPVITSEGQAFPVETKWLDRPVPKTARFAETAANLIQAAIRETTGGVLVFLPGEGEIRRVEGLLNADNLPGCTVHPLFGALPFTQQRAAIAPATSGRKVVLATSIAETSLTIQDIRVVVDCGRARRSRFDPGSGMSRLVTERVSKAEATQRQGRAGRVAPGTCYRMWTKGEDGGLAQFAPAEIEIADLTGLALDLAQWGVTDPADVSFMTPPNPGAFAGAKSLLQSLGALDDTGRITGHGRDLAKYPAHPRLAHMLELAGKDAALLAALLSNGDPLRGVGADLGLRKSALTDPKAFNRTHPGQLRLAAADRIRADARQLAKIAPEKAIDGWAVYAAYAYPDRIGLRRKGDDPRWVLSGGKGAKMAADDPLAGASMIVATDLSADTPEARIRSAAQLDRSTFLDLFGDQITWQDTCEWSRKLKRVVAVRRQAYGALALQETPWKNAPQDAIAAAALNGLRELGLNFSPKANRLRTRMQLTAANDPTFPDTSIEHLLATLDEWLLPHLTSQRTEADLKALDLTHPLKSMLTWEQATQMDNLAPEHFVTPMGNKVPIEYDGDTPKAEVRLQEMFGTTVHPTVGANRLPIQITLLSPARRPLQTTTNLPGFWATSYQDVRKDMRGRYPKHPWPEDPAQAQPTLRAKPRKP